MRETLNDSKSTGTTEESDIFVPAQTNEKFYQFNYTFARNILSRNVRPATWATNEEAAAVNEKHYPSNYKFARKTMSQCVKPVEYPFHVTEREDFYIRGLNTAAPSTILLLGRSGTGNAAIQFDR